MSRKNHHDVMTKEVNSVANPEGSIGSTESPVPLCIRPCKKQNDENAYNQSFKQWWPIGTSLLDC